MSITKTILLISLTSGLLTGCGRAGPPLAPAKMQQHKFILDPLLK